MFSAIIFVLSALGVFGMLLASEKRAFDVIKISKILAVVYCVIGLFRFLLADSFVETALDFSDPLQCIMRWGYYLGYAVIPLSLFFKSPLMRNISLCFTLPMAVLSAVFFNQTFSYFRAEGAGGVYANEVFVSVYYSTELILAIVLPIVITVITEHIPFKGGYREVLRTLCALPFMMIIMVPAYIPQAILGYPDISTSSFSTLHLGWILLLAAAIAVLYFIFRRKSEDEKYILILFLTVAQFYHTNSIFLRGFEWSRLPLQLCSIAAYFYLFTVLTKKRIIFDFCFLVNLVGGLIAIALADFGSDSLSFWNIHYIYEHTFVMMVPILAHALGLFGRLTATSLKNALRIFAIYFASSFIIGSLINYIANDGYTVNFFYMFNYETAINYVPFATFTGLIDFSIGHFKIYPLLIITVFVFFNALFIGFYYLMKLLYRLRDKKAPVSLLV